MVIMPGGLAIETGVVSGTIEENRAGGTDAPNTPSWQATKKWSRANSLSNLLKGDAQEPRASVDRAGTEPRLDGSPGLTVNVFTAPQSDASYPLRLEDSLFHGALDQALWNRGVDGVVPAGGEIYIPEDEVREVRDKTRQEIKEQAETERRIYTYSLHEVNRHLREHPQDEEARKFVQEANRALFPRHLGYLSYDEMPDAVKADFDAFSDVWIEQGSDFLGKIVSLGTVVKVVELAYGVPLSAEWKAANQLLATLKKADPEKARWIPFSRPAFRFLARCANDSLNAVYGEEVSVFDDTNPNNATWEKKEVLPLGRSREVRLVRPSARYDREVWNTLGRSQQTESIHDFHELTPDEQEELEGLFKAQKEGKPGMGHGISMDGQFARELDFQVVPMVQQERTNGSLIPDIGVLEELLRFPEENKWRAGGPNTMLSQHQPPQPSIVIVRPQGTLHNEAVMPTVVIDGSLVANEQEEGMRAFFEEHFPGSHIIINRGDVGLELAQLAISQTIDRPHDRYHVPSHPFYDAQTVEENIVTPSGWPQVEAPEIDMEATNPTKSAEHTAQQMMVGTAPEVATPIYPIEYVVPPAEVTAAQAGKNIVVGSSRGEWIGVLKYAPRLHGEVRERGGRILPEGVRQAGGWVGREVINDRVGDAFRTIGRPEGVLTTQEVALNVRNILNGSSDADINMNTFAGVDRAFRNLTERNKFPRGSEGVVAKVVREGEHAHLAVQQLNPRIPYHVYMSYRPYGDSEVFKLTGKKLLVPFAPNTPGERKVLVIPPIKDVPQERIDALASSVLRMGGNKDLAQLFNDGLQRLYPKHPPVAVGVMKVAA